MPNEDRINAQIQDNLHICPYSNRSYADTFAPEFDNGTNTDFKAANISTDAEKIFDIHIEYIKETLSTIQKDITKINEKISKIETAQHKIDVDFANFKGETSSTQKWYWIAIGVIGTVIVACASHYFFNVLSSLHQLDKDTNYLRNEIEHIKSKPQIQNVVQKK